MNLKSLYRDKFKSAIVFYVVLVVATIAMIVCTVFTVISTFKLIYFIIQLNNGSIPPEYMAILNKGNFSQFFELDSYSHILDSLITAVITQVVSLFVLFQFTGKSIWYAIKYFGRLMYFILSKCVLRLLSDALKCIRWIFTGLLVPLRMSITLLGIIIAIPLAIVILCLGGSVLLLLLSLSAVLICLPLFLIAVILFFTQLYGFVLFSYILLFQERDDDLFLGWIQDCVDNGFKGNKIWEYRKKDFLDMPFYENIEIVKLLGKEQSPEQPNIVSYSIKLKPYQINKINEICEEYKIKNTFDFNKVYEKVLNGKDIEIIDDFNEVKLSLRKAYEKR